MKTPKTLLTVAALLVAHLLLGPQALRAQQEAPLPCTSTEAMAKLDALYAMAQTLVGPKPNDTKDVVHKISDGLNHAQEDLIKAAQSSKQNDRDHHNYDAAKEIVQTWNDLDKFVAQGKITNTNVAQQMDGLFCMAEQCVIYLYYPTFDYPCQ